MLTRGERLSEYTIQRAPFQRIMIFYSIIRFKFHKKPVLDIYDFLVKLQEKLSVIIDNSWIRSETGTPTFIFIWKNNQMSPSVRFDFTGIIINISLTNGYFNIPDTICSVMTSRDRKTGIFRSVFSELVISGKTK